MKLTVLTGLESWLTNFFLGIIWKMCSWGVKSSLRPICTRTLVWPQLWSLKRQRWYIVYCHRDVMWWLYLVDMTWSEFQSLISNEFKSISIKYVEKITINNYFYFLQSVDTFSKASIKYEQTKQWCIKCVFDNSKIWAIQQIYDKTCIQLYITQNSIISRMYNQMVQNIIVYNFRNLL